MATPESNALSEGPVGLEPTAGACAEESCTRSEGFVTNSRGQKLYTVAYPAHGQPNAVVFAHHGLAEHIGRYKKAFQAFAQAGVTVFALDAHGHGRSEPSAEPDRALIHDYRHLVDDFYCVVDHILPSLPSPSPPLFVLGHSMGGLVAALACLRRQDMWAGCLLHSPAIDVEWTPVLRVQAAIGGLLAALVPRARLVPAVRPEDMSPDPEVVRSYVEDPLNFVGPVRARTANEMLRGFRELQRHAKQLRLPLYVSHGSLDKCTSAAASQALVQRGVSSEDKCFHLVEGGFHELLHGPEREQCVERMVAWMLERASNRLGNRVPSTSREMSARL